MRDGLVLVTDEAVDICQVIVCYGVFGVDGKRLLVGLD
jgi:hypothetical protein